MLWIGGKQIGWLFIGSKPVQSLYIGAKLVWLAIRGCFGSGRWINEKPWRHDEGWKN